MSFICCVWTYEVSLAHTRILSAPKGTRTQCRTCNKEIEDFHPTWWLGVPAPGKRVELRLANCFYLTQGHGESNGIMLAAQDSALFWHPLGFSLLRLITIRNGWALGWERCKKKTMGASREFLQRPRTDSIYFIIALFVSVYHHCIKKSDAFGDSWQKQKK